MAQALQATQGTALPAAVADAVTQLLRQVARPERLTRAEGVEQALRQSGLLLESTLLAALRGQGPVPGDDLKGSLFRILARTDAALGRVEALSLAPADVEALLAMKRELEGALGRITLQQLNSLPQDLPGMRHWQLEIPIQLAGSFHSLRVDIEQERSGDGSSPTRDDDDQWRVTLQLAPPAIGAVEIRLALRGETLTARFAAARPAVRQLIDAGLPRLATALESRGITLTAGPAAELQPAARAAADAPAAGASVDLRA